MGKEFASAASRWLHLADMDVRPEIVAVCDVNASALEWFKANIASISQATTDYKELLANPEVEAVYCAVPHSLHEELYTAIISAGKHLMGEKPFGIDKAANDAILACIKKHPNVFVRSSSEFPFCPAVQRICNMIDGNEFGEIIEVKSGFLHSSDMDTSKPINWKRMIKANGEYGCMGDLGMHACHVPFRAGWIPKNVRAILSNLVMERPDGKGGMAPCETWDNALLLCEVENPVGGKTFPWSIETYRIAPGEKDSWYIEVYGMKRCAKFSSKNINTIRVLDYSRGGEQAWSEIDMGQETAFATITGGIFEFGFSDAVLQMWAAFVYELAHGKPMKRFSSCVTPEETAVSHRLFTAALESHKNGSCAAV